MNVFAGDVGADFGGEVHASREFESGEFVSVVVCLGSFGADRLHFFDDGVQVVGESRRVHEEWCRAS